MGELAANLPPPPLAHPAHRWKPPAANYTVGATDGTAPVAACPPAPSRYAIFPIAQQWISSAVAGMLNGAVPIFVATIASCMLQKLPRGAQLAGLIVGFLGVVLVSLPSAGQGETQAIGVLLVLIATLCYGVSVNIAAPIQQKYGSLPVM